MLETAQNTSTVQTRGRTLKTSIIANNHLFILFFTYGKKIESLKITTS